MGTGDPAVETDNIKDANVTHVKLSKVGDPTGAAVKTINILDGNVTHEKLADNAVEEANIKDSNVTHNKLATDAVKTKNILNANVTHEKLADDAVEEANIKDSSVTLNKLATNSVDNTKLKTDAVKTNKISDQAVTHDKLSTTSTTDGDGNEIGAAVKTINIVDLNVTHEKLANNAVKTTNILDGNVTHDKLADNAVETDNIKDANVTHVKLSKVGDPTGAAVKTINILDFNVTHDKLSKVGTGDPAVETDNIKDGAVTNLKIGLNAVETKHILNGNVTFDKLANGGGSDAAVAEDAIRPDAVTTNKIKNGNVTTDKIADGHITNAKIANNTIKDDKTDFDNLTINGTLFAEAVVVGGTSDSVGTMNLAKVKSKSLEIDVPTPARGGDQPWVHPTPSKRSQLENAGTDGEHAQGWTIPATAANGFIDTITTPGTETSNGIIGGSQGILTYSGSDNVKGTLIMWSVNVRSSGQEPLSITAKTFVQLQDELGNNSGVPEKVDTQVLHTDVTDVGEAIAETIMSSQSTYIATSNKFIKQIWVEISHARSIEYAKAIVPNGSYFNVISLIVSDGSLSDSELTYSTPYVELH